MALFGAVNPRNGKLVTMMISPFDAESFRCFLVLLARHRRRSGKTIFVADNAPYHHGTELQPFPTKRADRFRLDFLPPFSPQLNPTKRVWKLLRKLCLHNQYLPDLETLTAAISRQMTIGHRPNDILKRLCGTL
jgi:transposase